MDGDLDVPILDHRVSWLIPSQLLIPNPHASHPGPICSQTHLYCREPRAQGWSPCCLLFHLVGGIGIRLEGRGKGNQGIFLLPVSLRNVSGSC